MQISKNANKSISDINSVMEIIEQRLNELEQVRLSGKTIEERTAFMSLLANVETTKAALLAA